MPQARSRTGARKRKGGQAPGKAAVRSERMAQRPQDAPRPLKSEPGGWKASVHRYVQWLNQAEIDRFDPDADGIVTDLDHMSRYRRRLSRLREQELRRGVLPLRSETSAELLRMSASESMAEATAMIELKIKRTVQQLGRTYTEDRRERERLWLAQDGGSYRIIRIEPLVMERRPKYSMSDSFVSQLTAGQLSEDEEKPKSMPYINYEVMPQFKQGRTGIRYRRDLAAAYADQWWNEPNPAYETFEVNCTNYVSQCLFAGHAPMNYTGKREAGWWYRERNAGRENWSYSWAVAGALQLFLSGVRQSGLRATVVDSADQLELGDVIIYDWSGDNRYQHSTIVTAFDAAGMPLVNANTVPSRHRYWDYRDSYAWTEQTKYRFFHISDEL
ncbi:hypothetical protein GCM10010911_52660 [Paenibacillus nasutitermitis]|uniref:Putative amidase domain-containing protein n=2 Tax=Paenibacillus nasutitermitis TaxID=1652958 RepID=A0A917E178_9BACL|nr:hypothetical protein GCM10010911_52660 [Paenibacillus nasutitermitis]